MEWLALIWGNYHCPMFSQWCLTLKKRVSSNCIGVFNHQVSPLFHNLPIPYSKLSAALAKSCEGWQAQQINYAVEGTQWGYHSREIQPLLQKLIYHHHSSVDWLYVMDWMYTSYGHTLWEAVHEVPSELPTQTWYHIALKEVEQKVQMICGIKMAKIG